MLQTYQTKIKNSDTSYLDEVSSFFGYIERKLFLDSFVRGESRTSCKNRYLKKYNITARQYNSIYINLEGKIKAVLELNKLHLSELEDRIKSIKKFIDTNTEKKAILHKKVLRLEKTNSFSQKFYKAVKQYRNIKFLLHQKNRKLTNLEQKLVTLKDDIDSKRIRICFGSKSLLKKQFNLEENKYASHEDWRKDWINARSSQYFSVGSKDESSGNQTCTYNDSGELRIRVADRFKKRYGKYIVYENIKFPYGQEFIDNAIRTYMGTTQSGKPAKYVNSAISYRFNKNKYGWDISATVDRNVPDIITSTRIGAIGIDMNAGFVNSCEVDRFGNPLKEEKIPLNMYNRSSDQITASIGDVVKYIVEKTISTQKPIIIEDLDFSRKKAILGEESKKYSRMLSGFAYSKFKEMLKARAVKYGVEVIEVNPAYTSVIGQMKFMKRYGLSSHGSAACVIARQGLGFKLEEPKYDSILGNFRKYISHKPLRSRWASISFSIKKKHSFNDRIELLKLDC